MFLSNKLHHGFGDITINIVIKDYGRERWESYTI